MSRYPVLTFGCPACFFVCFFFTLSNQSFSSRRPLSPEWRQSPTATTTLVATETGTPGNHSICSARRITTDPLKMQVTRQTERERDRKRDREKRERQEKKQTGKPWLVAKVTLRQHSLRRLGAIGRLSGGPSCDRVDRRGGGGAGDEPVCVTG